MKIAVCGKGGVGKSTVAAAIALTLARKGERVLALDADPDANLASALGMTDAQQTGLLPISRQIALIEERTGTKIEQYGKVFKLNPEVSDVAEKFAQRVNDVDLLVLGAVQNGGGGCACPESTFIRALVTDLVLYKKETLIMDMEAGIEHLGRGTAHGVDVMLIVAEPGKRSIDCAKSVVRMAGEIGVKNLLFIGNKITSDDDVRFLKENLPGEMIAALPYSDAIRNADRDGMTALDAMDTAALTEIQKIIARIGGDA